MVVNGYVIALAITCLLFLVGIIVSFRIILALSRAIAIRASEKGVISESLRGWKLVGFLFSIFTTIRRL